MNTVLVNHVIILNENVQMDSIYFTKASSGRLIKFRSILFQPANHVGHEIDNRVKSITLMLTNREIIHKTLDGLLLT